MFRDATGGFPEKSCLRNEHRNSILMMCNTHIWVELLIGWKCALPNQHYADLGKMPFFSGKTPVALQNVGCFHRLIILMPCQT